MTKKNRLDVHLLTKGLVPTREHAQKLIRAGQVRDISGNLLDKPGKQVSNDLEITIKRSPKYVSRGGEKIEAALDQFPIKTARRVCLDAGISTGGFTDCLLQRGASQVYGIDVGYGQIAWSLRNDSRVVLRERTNIRNLKPMDLYDPRDIPPSLAVADLSFISLQLVLPSIKSLLKQNDHEALLLVKPQFEVGRDLVGKGGVVKDPKSHLYALTKIMDFAKSQGWKIKGAIASPITGPAGNHEYFLWISSHGNEQIPNLHELVKNTL
ncbi:MULTISPECIES: TlyA family RNA methyltransferase [unclassified Prochlorococcus]|uniref:TlyA family RNA methyltransferase n=1 Tax=unclassified Prochlorococcus TaxID=2627481 RepID=UPI000533A09D|nr:MULTISPECIES: TlyA family RNA methyltransferase [unclassified Prochlorococcus]KGG15791.1 RNA binding methyltransferase FtsJ like [Prochlorococcus sp. MIT 0603]